MDRTFNLSKKDSAPVDMTCLSISQNEDHNSRISAFSYDSRSPLAAWCYNSQRRIPIDGETKAKAMQRMKTDGEKLSAKALKEERNMQFTDSRFVLHLNKTDVTLVRTFH